jgi:hypothetical protein
VSQAGVVTRLAVRELWITFRLLVLLVGFVGAGAAVALLPAPLNVTMGRLAAGLSAATLLATAVAAWSIADERVRGRAGWLVSRSVSRGTYLRGWFVAMTEITLVGVIVAAALGWLAATGVALRLEPQGYVALAIASATTAIAAVALGLLAGVLLRRRPAAVVAVVTSALVGLAAWLLPGAEGILPGGAFVALAGLTEGAVAQGPVWRMAGTALLIAGVLLVLARVALDRAEL